MLGHLGNTRIFYDPCYQAYPINCRDFHTMAEMVKIIKIICA